MGTGYTRAERLMRLRALTANGDARRIRQAARLSQEDIAVSIGADQSTVARWERGERVPRGVAAIRYAVLLAKLEAATAAPKGAA